jgi:hypothetical protein
VDGLSTLLIARSELLEHISVVEDAVFLDLIAIIAAIEILEVCGHLRVRVILCAFGLLSESIRVGLTVVFSQCHTHWTGKRFFNVGGNLEQNVSYLPGFEKKNPRTF